MNIKEVLNLPIDTEVKSGNNIFIVTETSCNGKGLIRTYGGFLTLSEGVINAEYELVRKKLNFFEAMRVVDEGKVVSNDRYPVYNYKKIDGVLNTKKTDRYYKTISIDYKELEANWYEVIEQC